MIDKLNLQQDEKECYIYENMFLKRITKSKNYWKFRDHCYYTDRYGDI